MRVHSTESSASAALRAVRAAGGCPRRTHARAAAGARVHIRTRARAVVGAATALTGPGGESASPDAAAGRGSLHQSFPNGIENRFRNS